ncbi:hypothetical protein QOT17_002939 [Balamuthia mandrillaris]
MTFRLFCLAGLVFLALLPSCHSISFHVAKRSEECLTRNYEEGDIMMLEFFVVKGGIMDIQLVVEDPSGTVVHSRMHTFAFPPDDDEEAEQQQQKPSKKNKKKEELVEEGWMDETGYFEVDVQEGQGGRWKVCFSNLHSRTVDKTVTVTFIDADSKSYHEAATIDAKYLSIHSSVHTMTANARDIDWELKMQRVRDQVNHQYMEGLLFKIEAFSWAEGLTLIVVTIIKILVLKGWFLRKDLQGRPV